MVHLCFPVPFNPSLPYFLITENIIALTDPCQAQELDIQILLVRHRVTWSLFNVVSSIQYTPKVLYQTFGV